MASLSRDASQGRVSESSSSDSSKQAAVVWPNKKDDYELLDVVGMLTWSIGWVYKLDNWSLLDRGDCNWRCVQLETYDINATET